MRSLLFDRVRRSSHGVPLALFLAGLCALFLFPLSAGAHTEGVMQLAAEPAGPYNLTVWTSPDPATTSEELHVAIAVVLAEDASPILEADVLVELTPEDGGPVIAGPATIENSDNKFLHEAIIAVDQGGFYQVAITVEEANGVRGDASFPLEIEGGSGMNWTLIVVALVVVAAVVILMARYRRNPESVAAVSTKSKDDSPAAK